MRDTPTAEDLLLAARTTLLQEVLPGLSNEHRYAALMVANAIGIGAREMAADSVERSREEQQIKRLARITGQTGDQNFLEHALCNQLRTAEASDLWRPELCKYLKEDVQSRLSISNPRRVDAP